jgi:hypothetical protein
MRAIVMVMKVAWDKEGEGGMVMATMSRMASKQWQWEQRGQW